MMKLNRQSTILCAACALVLSATTLQADDPLPSWNDTKSKTRLLSFVARVTKPDSPDFVPKSDRIAVFDNDGTLWSERPVYFQALFVFDRIKTLAPDHPEWTTQEPFASVLRGDMRNALAGGEKALVEMVMATHAGMTTEEFEKIVADWISTAKHPETGRLFTEMTYQPMQDILAHLRQNGFKIFIVSGGGIEFLRVWAERVYSVPPEQVIGSSIKTRYEVRDGNPVIVRLPELNFIDDKAKKPIGIHQHIGRRPILAFGNSDGDFEMLEWTTTGKGARLGLLVHHDDATREYAYDRDSHVGRLSRGLDEAASRGWIVVSMKNDWRSIYSTTGTADTNQIPSNETGDPSVP